MNLDRNEMNSLDIGLRRPVVGLMMAIMVMILVPEILRQLEMLGFVAASCTTLSFLPQVIHTLKTKNTEGISLTMYLMFLVGIFCWLVYGFKSGDLPLVIGNGITLVLASVIFALKLKASIEGEPR